MASGPTGTGWWALVDQLNVNFSDPAKRGKFAKQFKDKHGNKGEGEANTPKRPYKFGQFVDQFVPDAGVDPLLSSDNERAQFLIDAGTRHWDPTSLDLLEHAIKQSLTHLNAAGQPDPKEIKFSRPTTEPTAVLARAEIKSSASTTPLRSKQDIDNAVDAGSTLSIDIICPNPNLRPTP